MVLSENDLRQYVGMTCKEWHDASDEVSKFKYEKNVNFFHSKLFWNINLLKFSCKNDLASVVKPILRHGKRAQMFIYETFVTLVKFKINELCQRFKNTKIVKKKVV